MSKFNRPGTRPAVFSPIVTEPAPTGVTHEGTAGYLRDTKGELFLLAVANLVREPTFYEGAPARDTRFTALVQRVAIEDPAWMAAFLPWLRTEGFMRDAPMVAALDATHAMLAARIPGARRLIASVLQRADEPGKAIDYWRQTYGRKLPMPVKRGIGDAALRLYREYPLMKYDTPSHGYRFADVLSLTHAGDRPGSAQHIRGDWQHALFDHAIGRRFGPGRVGDRGRVDPEMLPMIAANARLRDLAGEDPSTLLDPDRLRAAGMTWEDALSLAGSRVPKAQLWEALVPVMAYGALLKNLRNLDEAGIGRATRDQVIARLIDPDQVRRSRQFPMAFLAARNALNTYNWHAALDEAIGYSVSNVPALKGRTLILVDVSFSMYGVPLSARSTLSRSDGAKIFGAALAVRNPGSTLVAFSTGHARVSVPPAASLLRVVSSIPDLRQATNTAQAIRAHFDDHDRVVIVTDEQYHGESPTQAVAESVPMYTFNLAGYRTGHGPSGSGTRHTFGGLTDATFRLIPLLEAGRDAAWPFEVERAEPVSVGASTMLRRGTDDL